MFRDVTSKDLGSKAKKVQKTAVEAAAGSVPVVKALRLAKLALNAAKKAGNAKKVASLQKKVSLLSKKKETTTPKFSKSPVNRHLRDMSKKNAPKKTRTGATAAKKLKEAQEKERKYFEDKGYYRTPSNPSEAGGGMK